MSIVFDFASVAAHLKKDAPSASQEKASYCSACENGGWECYGIGLGDPHFRECKECGNPLGLESP